MIERPYTPETLAERWGCSSAHVRSMIRRGELAHFRLGGKLLRISAEEVARCESQGSSDTGESTPSDSSIPDNGGAIRLARQIRASRGPVLLTGNNRTGG